MHSIILNDAILLIGYTGSWKAVAYPPGLDPPIFWLGPVSWDLPKTFENCLW